MRAGNDVQPDWRDHLQNTKKSDVSAKAQQATGTHFTDRMDLAQGMIWCNQSLDASFAECSASLFFGNILFNWILLIVATRAIVLVVYGLAAGAIASANVTVTVGRTVTRCLNGKFGSTGRFRFQRVLIEDGGCAVSQIAVMACVVVFTVASSPGERLHCSSRLTRSLALHQLH